MTYSSNRFFYSTFWMKRRMVQDPRSKHLPVPHLHGKENHDKGRKPDPAGTEPEDARAVDREEVLAYHRESAIEKVRNIRGAYQQRVRQYQRADRGKKACRWRCHDTSCQKVPGRTRTGQH